jgi:hypothetical protein
LATAGFELTPSQLSEQGKATLRYNPNALTLVQTGTQQDFISFTRKPKSRTGYGNEDLVADWDGYLPNEGKIEISFDPNYIPKDANVIIRVGATRPFLGGEFYSEFEGRFVAHQLLSIEGFQAINISKLINRSRRNSIRKQPLGKIIITAPFLYTWKFFSARYNGLRIIKIV